MDAKEMAKEEVGYCAKLHAKLEFAAALVDEAGDHVLGELISDAAEMLTVDGDLDLIEQRDNLKDAVERADALFATIQEFPHPTLSSEFEELVAAWRKDFGSEP